ncbi:MAG TPA: CCA tRNA nucleotidyltransferase, partial [Hyphomicrobium sp.]|nr:CCA tRNA nucleotidyltransferase [Hyphomicrobium sp.]
MQEGSELPSLATADWLRRQETRAVFDALTRDGAEARAVGGAVRNALMGLPVKDVDIATTALPHDVTQLAKRAGLQTVPTGIDHGTVTVIAGKVPFEVTTLRRDVETFGRHARVTFSTDWREDAMRRDFTMNALYVDADGVVHDPLGGYADLAARRVRFIGDARERIREDYLRILRFFRFLAEYGDPTAPDPEGLAAVQAERAGLAHLSGERIRAELLRLLGAPGAVPAAAAMRKAGILIPLIGVEGDVVALERLAAIEKHLAHAPDPLLRLAALASTTPLDLQTRLRLSSAEGRQLTAARRCATAFDPHRNEAAAKEFIYRNGAEDFTAGALLDWARSHAEVDDAARTERVTLPARWTAP